MFIGFKRLLAALVLVPGSAFGACVQSDLTGTWRFHLNNGEMTSNNRLFRADCVVVIRNNGMMEPRACKSLDATMDSSTLTIAPPETPLTALSNCDVTWGGGEAEFLLLIGSSGQIADRLRLSLSSGKDTLLGYGFTASGLGIMSVHAIKRAQ